ncbi:putative membrane protein [Sphingopyxis sp. LC81]|uniref:DUF805 domain-containing protein n=1 Tax=Sphingopyxis sp. LC81 TaxID=1502850 RepID=UPI00050FF77E|nr:DUF805 domain-containing protein [Sphingopyxis sp. LC81]KGB53454.1 putative membrane protein [Sphingopyxis sp. LC81]
MQALVRRFFPVGRCTRGRLFALLILGSIGTFAADFATTGRVELMLNLGFRFDALSDPASYAWWRVAAEVVFGLVLVYMAVGRLHDIARPGWWLALLVALPYAGEAVGLPELAFVSLILWLALIFWSPTIGPNAYGADPRGWKSREQYDAQQAALNPKPDSDDQPATR